MTQNVLGSPQCCVVSVGGVVTAVSASRRALTLWLWHGSRLDKIDKIVHPQKRGPGSSAMPRVRCLGWGAQLGCAGSWGGMPRLVWGLAWPRVGARRWESSVVVASGC